MTWTDLVPLAVALEQHAWERRRDCVRMTKLGLSQRQIARRLGCSGSRVAQMQARHRRYPIDRIAPVTRWQRGGGEIMALARKIRFFYGA